MREGSVGYNESAMAGWHEVLRRWAPWAPELPRALEQALAAVDPQALVARHLERQGNRLRVGSVWYDLGPRRVRVLALGKAAHPMAQAAARVLGPLLEQGLLITRAGYEGPPPRGFRVHLAEHPVPGPGSLQAGERVRTLLRGLTEQHLLLVLLSGGGSALLVDPGPGLTLEDIRETHALLLQAGADIHQINTVRKHLEGLKGGGLARLAAPARVHTLVLSDVPGDDLSVVASGPTVPDPTTYHDAWAVVEALGLVDRLPPRVRQYLQAGLQGRRPETLKPEAGATARLHHTLIGSVRTAAEAAWAVMHQAGWSGGILTTRLEGEAREVARVLTGLAHELVRYRRPFTPPACWVLGGETAVTVRGEGRGGRNQELALAAVPGLHGLARTALVALATDGMDGPTDAAGAIATHETLTRARALGLEPRRYLQRNDAYTFWKRLGGLLQTGPTRTNVNDLVLLCVAPSS